jgi:hypothetical protein
MAANTLAPSGFQTLRRWDGTNPNYAMREHTILYNYGTRINYGDPVILYTNGTIRVYANGGGSVHGVFRGCRYLDPGTGRTQFYQSWTAPTLASTTVVFALIDGDPFTTYMCQVNGTALDQTSIGKNLDVTASTTGTSTSSIGMSTATLDGAAINTTATFPFRLIGIIGLQGTLAQANTTPAITAAYNPTSDNQWVEVAMNRNDMLITTGQQQ